MRTISTTLKRVLVPTAAAAALTVAVGCESNNNANTGGGVLRAGLPPQAQRQAEGTGQLTFTPDRSGQVYIYDTIQDRVVGRYQLRAGQRLAVDAADGRATVDGNEVKVGDLKPKSNYRIYFLPLGG